MMVNLLELDDDTLDTQVIPYLSTVIGHATGPVVDIVWPYFGSGERWNRRLFYLLRCLRRWTDPKGIAFFERVIREVPEFDLKNLYELDDVAQTDAKAGCRLIRALFDRILSDHQRSLREHAEQGLKLRDSKPDKPIDDAGDSQIAHDEIVWMATAPNLDVALQVLNGSSIQEALKTVAEVEPTEFLQQMLLWLEEALKVREEPETEVPNYVADPLCRFWNGGGYVTIHLFIDSLITAMVKLAEQKPDEFRRIATRLAALSTRTPHQLLCRVYAQTADRLAGEAVEYLKADSRRLRLGDTQSWESRQLIKAIVPHLTGQQKAEFLLHVLNYDNEWERKRSYPGFTQMLLLGELEKVLSSEEWSPEAAQHLAELRRKGYRVESEPSVFIATRRRSREISQAITKQVGAKMSDQAWLRAMGQKSGNKLLCFLALEARARQAALQKFPSGVDEHVIEEVLSDDLFGSSSLSGYSGAPPECYVEKVKTEPARFAALLLRAPEYVSSSWIEATINGIVESNGSLNLLEPLIARFVRPRRRELARTICFALQNRMRRDQTELPPEIMAWLEEQVRDTSLDRYEINESISGIYGSYANSRRGLALDTLMHELDRRANETRSEDAGTPADLQAVSVRAKQWELIEFITQCIPPAPSTLRVGAVEWLLYVMYEDSPRAIALFEKLLEGHPAALESRYTQDFIYRALYKNFTKLRPYIVALMCKGLDTKANRLGAAWRKLKHRVHQFFRTVVERSTAQNDAAERQQLADSEIDSDDFSVDANDVSCRQRGAEIACLAWLSPGTLVTKRERAEARRLATHAKIGRAAWRRGAARIFAYNLQADSVCAQELIPLLNDEDERVRKTAMESIRFLRAGHMAADGTSSRRGFVEALAASRTLAESPESLCEWLWEHGALYPSWTLQIIHQILDNPYTTGEWPPFAGAEDLVRLVLRIANLPMSTPQIRTEAMDEFDRLMERFTTVAHNVLDEWDRV
jgi:hypothetical protein